MLLELFGHGLIKALDGNMPKLGTKIRHGRCRNIIYLKIRDYLTSRELLLGKEGREMERRYLHIHINMFAGKNYLRYLQSSGYILDLQKGLYV